MPFLVHINDRDRKYLDELPLSETAKGRIDEFIRQSIAEVSDQFRLDPENRPDPGMPFFRTSFLILDIWGDRRLHLIDFFVRDDNVPYGVLLIAYVEHHQGQNRG